MANLVTISHDDDDDHDGHEYDGHDKHEEEDCQPFLPNSSNIPTVFASVRVRSEITLTPPPFVPEVNRIDKPLPDVADSKLTIRPLYCGRTL